MTNISIEVQKELLAKYCTRKLLLCFLSAAEIGLAAYVIKHDIRNIIEDGSEFLRCFKKMQSL